jgi:hypothetical protein
MDRVERIKRDIDTLRESIKIDNDEIRSLHLTGERLQGALQHIGWCMTELDQLKKTLEKASHPDRS